MIAVAKRTVVHALLSFTDAKGRSRMALRGSEVELAGEELERAERIGAVQEGPLVLGGPVVEPAAPVAAAEAGALLDEPVKPARAAAKSKAAD